MKNINIENSQLFKIFLILISFYVIGNSVQARVKNISGILERNLIPLNMKNTKIIEIDPVKQVNGIMNKQLPSLNYQNINPIDFQNFNRFEDRRYFEIKR